MGSWVRTITSPFRKARTVLASSRVDDVDRRRSSSSSHHHPKKPRRQHSSSAMAHGGGAGAGGDVERPSSSQLYGDVMACAYEDVQVMWSMLDNKARLCSSAAAAAAS